MNNLSVAARAGRSHGLGFALATALLLPVGGLAQTHTTGRLSNEFTSLARAASNCSVATPRTAMAAGEAAGWARVQTGNFSGTRTETLTYVQAVVVTDGIDPRLDKLRDALLSPGNNLPRGSILHRYASAGREDVGVGLAHGIADLRR
jgi:hypothetical protein